MRRLRVAVIGAGHLGTIHARLLARIPEAQLVGVVDPLAAARQRVARELEAPTFAHHREVAPQLDAAIIAATTDQHHRIGSDLLSQGVHLLVEKPLARTTAEADQLVREARHRQLVLQVGHVERFNPAWRAAAPHLRRPRYIEAVRTSGYTGRSTDIGTVLDLMIHDLDLVLSLVRSEVVEVSAIGATIFGPHEDLAHAHLRFANGCFANLNASRTSFESQRKMQIVTERAYAGIDFAAPSAKLIRPSKRVLRGEIDVQQLSAQQREWVRGHLFDDLLPMKELSITPTNAILDEQREFVSCIIRGRQPRVSGDNARECVRVAEQILAQIQAGLPHFGRPSPTTGGPQPAFVPGSWAEPRKAG